MLTSPLSRLLSTLAATALFISSATGSTPVFFDSFDEWYIGDTPGTPWEAEHGTDATIRVILDTTGRFEEGASNQILEWRKEDVIAPMSLWARAFFGEEPASEVLTFSFNFIEAGAPGMGDWVSLYAYAGDPLGPEGELNVENRAQRILIGRGSVGNAGYVPGTLVRADIIVNNSNDPVEHSFRGQSYTVLPGTFQTWFNGSLASSGFARDNNHRGPIHTFQLNTTSNNKVLAWFDNLTVYNGIVLREIEVELDPVLFRDSFDFHALDLPPGGPWTETVDGAGRGTVLVLQDHANVFGRGTSNQLLEYKGDGTVNAMALRATNVFATAVAPEVATFSFRLFEPDSPGNKDLLSLFIYAGTGALQSGQQAQRVLLGRGKVADAAYSYGEAIQVDVVINNSNNTVDYQDGAQTLAPGTFDVWFDGKLVLGGFANAHSVKGPIRSFQLQNSTNNTPLVLFDDFLVRNRPFVTQTGGEPSPLEEWRAAHFSPSELADPAISSNEADPDGDGIPNILEYAFGRDPRTASRAGLPAAATLFLEGETYLTLTFTRASSASDIVFTPEVSSDLINWLHDPQRLLVEGEVDNGDGTLSVTIRDNVPLGPGEDARFLHIRVDPSEN
jgi:hypothetical protein